MQITHYITLEKRWDDPKSKQVLEDKQFGFCDKLKIEFPLLFLQYCLLVLGSTAKFKYQLISNVHNISSKNTSKYNTNYVLLVE